MNFQRGYLNCLVDLWKSKIFQEVQESIERFISALSPTAPTLEKRLSSFFLLLVPVPISRGMSSLKKPPAQLVVETIPFFAFVLSRGKITRQAGRKEINFEMPLMRTVRECLALLSRVIITKQSEQSFKYKLDRFYEFLTRIYDNRRTVGEIIEWIKEAATLIGLLLAGEKNRSEVAPEDLKTAFQILRSILFRIPGIDWLVVERLSKFQRGEPLNKLIRWSISARQENQLKTYFNQRVGQVVQRWSLVPPDDTQIMRSIMFKSFINFLCLKRVQINTKTAINGVLDPYFTEFRQICEQTAGIAFSKAVLTFSEAMAAPEAEELLRVLKKRATEYTQLMSKKQASFLSYEYSTFIGHQRSLIVLLSMFNALKRADKKIGRNEILRGFTYWVDLVFEESVKIEALDQKSVG